MYSTHQLAKMIDHSILHPTMTDEDLIMGCKLAKEYDVASVCVKPYAVRMACDLLQDSDVAVGTVIGFPHGNSSIEVKVFETENAINNGAKEIDMVINIGKALGSDWKYIEREIESIVGVTRTMKVILKVIFENDYMPDDDHKIRLCRICNRLKVDYVKTSSGYGFVKGADGKYSYLGATEHDVELMRKHADPGIGVKAAGGVRTLDEMLKMVEKGVTRLGATATQAILDEAMKRYGE
ncbi:MAG: deoxyribose-phosphate aldolase [Bacteroides sp. SM23_62_1]|nr:MAG: deoxyribose-phosphate aldolase [Bacteroides sp. SM23_62_1]